MKVAESATDASSLPTSASWSTSSQIWMPGSSSCSWRTIVCAASCPVPHAWDKNERKLQPVGSVSSGSLPVSTSRSVGRRRDSITCADSASTVARSMPTLAPTTT